MNFSPAAARLGSPAHHLLNQGSSARVLGQWFPGKLPASSDLMAQKPGEVRQAARVCGLFLNRRQILSGGSARNILLIIPPMLPLAT